MSSLVQLAQSASLNAALLGDLSPRNPVSSSGSLKQTNMTWTRRVRGHSRLGRESFDPFISTLANYEDVLLSDLAKSTDRTLLSMDASRELDKSIEEFVEVFDGGVFVVYFGVACEEVWVAVPRLIVWH